MEHVQSPLTVVPAFSCRFGISDPEGGPRRLPLGTNPLGQLTGVWLLLQDLDAGNTVVGGSLSARGRVSRGHSHICSLKVWTS